MKKSVLVTAIAVMAVVLVGCKPQTEVATYPEDIDGYWASEVSTDNEWYSLEVGNNVSKQSSKQRVMASAVQTYALFSHYTNGEKEGSVFLDLNYESTTGKGELTAEGHTLTVQAKNDTTIVISATSGNEITLYKGVKPEIAEAAPLVACWQRVDETENNYYDNLLVYPEDNNGTMHATFFLEKNGAAAGIGVSVKSYDEFTNSGVLEVPSNGETGEVPFVITADTLYAGEGAYVAKAGTKNISIDKEGTWEATVMQFITITATIDAEDNCTLITSVPETFATQLDISTSDTISGKVFYNPYVGRGAFEYGANETIENVEEATDETTDKPEEEETQVSGTSVLFDAVSGSQVQISMTLNEVPLSITFDKK